LTVGKKGVKDSIDIQANLEIYKHKVQLGRTYQITKKENSLDIIFKILLKIALNGLCMSSHYALQQSMMIANFLGEPQE